MDSETFGYIMIIIIVLLLIFITIYQSNKHPNLHGLTIQDAEEKLKKSGKKIRLGTKIGFVEPKRNEFYLLGKINEQIYIPPTTPDGYGIMDYKLYQVNIPSLPPIQLSSTKPVVKEYVPEYIPPPRPVTPPPQPVLPPRPKSPPRKPKREALFNVPHRKNTVKQYGAKESFFW